jgi:hypothetical protein
VGESVSLFTVNLTSVVILVGSFWLRSLALRGIQVLPTWELLIVGAVASQSTRDDWVAQRGKNSADRSHAESHQAGRPASMAATRLRVFPNNLGSWHPEVPSQPGK